MYVHVCLYTTKADLGVGEYSIIKVILLSEFTLCVCAFMQVRMIGSELCVNMKQYISLIEHMGILPYWDYYPDTLSVSKITTTHLRLGTRRFHLPG